MRELIFLHANSFSHCTAQVDKQFDGYFSLQLMMRGTVHLSYDAVPYELSGAWLWTCWPGPQIRFGRAPNCDSWEHRYVAFAGALPTQWQTAGLWPQTPVPLCAQAASTCQREFDELLRLLENCARTSLQNWRALNQIERILLLAAEADTPQADTSVAAPMETWLQEALDWLSQAENAWPNYDVLAARCCMAKGTLRRRFRAEMGISLHEWVLNGRIARARKLLLETDWPIKRISAHLGYSDVWFFAAQFRQRVGVPPATFRRSRQLF